ncbi:MAG TPA: hypothetical protein VGJ11_00935 [Gaiellales bacterium]|jgi:Tol biopolymer transport system component
MHPDGSGLHTLATCNGGLCNQIMAPAWSPDGSRLAYIPRIERSANVVVATPTGRLTVVRACAGRRCITPNNLTWAPDGRELALVSATKQPGAYLITTTGRGMHAIGRDVQCCLAWLPSLGP